jgi:outer membrane receptor for ferrienterochelin and colicins
MSPFFASITRRKRSAPRLESMAAIFVALLFLPCTLHGQSVDYGALEQLFKEPVTTSVDGSPQRVSDVPATMEIITAEDIRRSGAKDIPGVLRHVGGVDTLEWGNDNIDVGVRGYDQAVSARLLVLVDGRQVYTDDYGYTPWSSVPVELGMIRQIEIIKGPNSALFGFNAAGGVINIITYNPLYDKVNAVSTTAGTQTLSALSGVATYQFGGRAAVRLSAGLNSDNDFTTSIPATEATASRLHQYSYAANLNSVLRLNEKTQLSTEATYSRSNLNEMQPSYSIANAIHQTWSWKGLFTKESRWGLIQASGYFNWSRDTITSEIAAGPLKLSLDDRLAVAQFQDIFKLGAHHTFRAATEYRYTTEDTTTVSGGDVYDSVVAVSGMWNWEISPTLTLTNALRLDHLALGRSGSVPPGYPFTDADWKRSFTPLSFNSGLVWKMSDADALRVMASRGVELPSLVENGALTLNLPGGYNTTGSPFLQPTEVTNYEIAWDRVMAGPHLLFRASAFHQKSDDIRAVTGGLIVGPSGDAYFLPANIGSSKANGLELGLRGTLLQNYRWRVDYRPEWIADHFIPSAQNGADFTDYQHTTPVHLMKANLGWANERWEIDGYLHYQSGTSGIQRTGIASGLTPVAGFVSMDARAAYKFRNWVTWSVSGQNLTHASQLQTVGPAVERRVLGTMSLHF